MVSAGCIFPKGATFGHQMVFSLVFSSAATSEFCLTLISATDRLGSLNGSQDYIDTFLWCYKILVPNCEQFSFPVESVPYRQPKKVSDSYNFVFYV